MGKIQELREKRLAEFQKLKIKKAIAFFDGQNLYNHAREAFDIKHPDYDPQKLLAAICEEKNWLVHGVRFYTGIHTSAGNLKWHRFWHNKILAMERKGVLVTKRTLQYHSEETPYDGSAEKRTKAREKGIDVRLALDMVRLARQKQYNVAILFSQDQDFGEVIKEVKAIAEEQNRWIELVCAFPVGWNASAKNGVYGCTPLEIDEALYRKCIDPKNYF